MAHPLDNPIWSSLSTRHASFAEHVGGTLRYPAPIAPFVGCPETDDLMSGLDPLILPGETVFLIGPQPAVPRGWALESPGALAQMVCERPMAEVDGPPILPLGEPERSVVLELTSLVYPHYFRSRTMELGRYFGIFEEGRLAAMVGERMAVPACREISAVCTHPAFVGRGLARRLLAFLTNDLLQQGELPFLHVSPANVRARELYAQNGYRVRSEVRFWSLRRRG